jgi:23S rRNA pseudouridine1911/1915/1917 synthase
VALKRLKFVAARDHTLKRLDEALGEWLPEALARSVSKSKVRKLIMAGAVRLNGKPVRNAAEGLVPGATIEAYVDVAKLFEDAPSRDLKFELTPDRILFEDEDLIVVDKPPGLPSQPTVDLARDSLFSAVQRFLPKSYVGVHHRLDRDTSGAVLFTKSERANAGMAESFSTHRVVKAYRALTVPGRKVDSEWTIKNYLGKVPSESRRARYGAVDFGGSFAETSFRLIEEYPRGLWIEAVPKTGRTHQIRVHLSEYGLPILSDDLYGRKSDLAPRLMLHAARLIFPHPVTGREMSVECPHPEDFRQCLSRLKSR